MENVNISSYSLENIDKCIAEFKKAKAKHDADYAKTKSNVDLNKSNNYKNLINNFEDAKTIIKGVIEKSKNTMTYDSEGKEITVYDKFVKDKEKYITLASLQEIMTISVDGTTVPNLPSVPVKPDFFDTVGGYAKDVVNGSGHAGKIFGVTLGVGVAELLSRLITPAVGMESTGIFGLAKLGIEHLPELGSLIKTGMSAFWGFSAPLVVLTGAVAALKIVPMIKHLVDKHKENNKADKDVAASLDKILADQQKAEEARKEKETKAPSV